MDDRDGKAEGEFQAADKLRQAAQIMTPYPMAMQMRYLQALADVASDENSTIIFPLPLELLGPFMRGTRHVADDTVGGEPADASSEMAEPTRSEKANGVGATPVTAAGNGR
jgi:hypothetical protein